MWDKPGKRIRFLETSHEHHSASDLARFRELCLRYSLDQVVSTGMATLQQVKRLPVAGPEVRLFTIGSGEFKPRSAARGKVRVIAHAEMAELFA